MKVIINNAEMVPTPKKGTIIRFGDCGLFVIGIYVGRSDEEPEDYEWIPEMEIEDVYGIDFMESLPNIDDGEMVEIRIKCTAEKCE